MNEVGESAAWVVFTSQAAWIARFLVALGVFGLVVWYLKRVIGLDLQRDINALEKMLHDAAHEKDVSRAIPFTMLALAAILVVGFVVGGFVH